MTSEKTWFGHPRGLTVLFLTNMWEQFSYYGMRALLVYYMTKHLLLTQGTSSLIYGVYTACAYFTPLIGGIIADRALGKKRAIIIGGSVMALGHFMMTQEPLFYVALVTIAVGNGLFLPSLPSQIRDLYQPGDPRAARAYNVYYVGVNIGGVLAMLGCGTLGEVYGWHWGFGAAGVGMVFGLMVYLRGRRWLAPEPARSRAGTVTAPRSGMTGREKARLAFLIALIPVLMLTIVGNQQFQNAYPLWSQKYMDLVLFGWQVPVTWLQAVDAVVSTATMLASIAFWRWWSTRRREPDELTKMAFGSILAAGGPALLIIASGLIESTHEKVSLVWTLGYTIVNDLGFANILPVGLALYSRVAPKRLEGLVIGMYYLHLFLANTFVGWLAGFLEIMPSAQFWGLHAALVAGAGVLLLACRSLFGAVLAPQDEAAPASAAT